MAGKTDTFGFNIDNTSPDVPVLISPSAAATVITTSGIEFDWEDVADPSGVEYTIQIDNDSDFSSPEIEAADLTVSEYTTIIELTEGNYSWRVKATDGIGNEGEWSEERAFIVDTMPSEVNLSVYFTPDYLPPDVPALVSPADGAEYDVDTGIELDWSDVNDKNGVAYDIQIDNNSDFSSPEISADDLSLSEYTTITALESGDYSWRVRAVDGNGNVSGWSVAWGFTIEGLPTEASILVSFTPEYQPPEQIIDLEPMAGETTDTSITFSWTVTADPGEEPGEVERTFDLKYADHLTDGQVGSEHITWSTTTTPGTLYQKTVENLNPGTSYYFQLRSADSNNNWSDWSAVAAEMTTAGGDALPPRTELQISEPRYEMPDVTYVASITSFSLSAIDDMEIIGDGLGFGVENSFYKIDDDDWAMYSDEFNLGENRGPAIYPDCIGYWSFDEGDGSMAIDYSGNGNDGAINGAVYVAGKRGKAMSFDGVDDYINLGLREEVAYALDTEISYCAWIKTESTISNMCVLGSMSDYGGNERIIITLNAGGTVGYTQLTVREQGRILRARTDEIPVADGNWHHLAILSTPATSLVKIYLDGIEQAVVTDRDDNPTDVDILPYDVYLGARNREDVPDQFYSGQMDEVEIYSRMLTEEEISARAETLEDGSHLLSYYSVDISGNEEEIHAQNLVLDNGVPDVVVNSPSGGEEYDDNDTITVDYDIDDVSPVVVNAYIKNQLTAEEIAVTDGQGIPVIDIAEGDWILTVEATDILGNTGAASSGIFEVTHGGDFMPPRTELQISDPKHQLSDTTYVTSATSFSLTAVDDMSIAGDGLGLGVENSFYKVDGNNWVTYGSAFSLGGVRSPTIGPDCIGYWSFDEGEGDTAIDYSGNNNNGMINGAEYVNGICGKAMSFDGVDDYINLGLREEVAYALDTEISYCAWIKTESTISNMCVLGSMSDSGGRERIIITLNAGGSVGYTQLTVREAGRILRARTDEIPIVDGNWHHLAILSTPAISLVKIYLDGIEQAVITDRDDNPTDVDILPYDVYLGARNREDVPDQFYNGQMDEVEIYSRMLSEEEILSRTATMEDGSHLLSYYSKDIAGNEEEILTQNLVLDNGNPVVTITSPAGGEEFKDNDTITINFDIEDVSPVTVNAYLKNQGTDEKITVTDGQEITGSAVPEGSWMLTVEATDVLGNSGTAASGVFTVIHENILPPAQITDMEPVYSETTEDSITVSWTVTADPDEEPGPVERNYDLKYSTYLTGGAVGSEHIAWSTITVAGAAESRVVDGLASGTTYYFQLRSADGNNNWSDWSAVTAEQTYMIYGSTDTRLILKYKTASLDGGTTNIYVIERSTSDPLIEFAISTAAASGLGLISKVYDVLPDGVSFSPPAELTFYYDETLLAVYGITDEEELDIYKYYPGTEEWLPVTPVIERNTDENYIKVELESCSIYAVLGEIPDLIPPDITITSPSAGDEYLENVNALTIDFTATDEESEPVTVNAYITHELGEIIPVSDGDELNLADITEGMWTLTVEAEDAVGNSTTAVTGAFGVYHAPHYPVVYGIEGEKFIDYIDPDGAPQTGADAGCSGGSYLGWIADGEQELYRVYLPMKGYYTLAVKYASPYADRALNVSIDGTPAYITKFSNTGGWDIWDVAAGTTAYLVEAGTHTVRLAHQGGYNVDYVSFQSSEELPVYVNSVDFREFNGIGEPGTEVEMTVKLAGIEYPQLPRAAVDVNGKFEKDCSIYAEDDNLFEVYGYGYSAEGAKSGKSNSVYVYLDRVMPVITVTSPEGGGEYIAGKDTVVIDYGVTDNINLPVESRAYLRHETGQIIEVEDGWEFEPVVLRKGLWTLTVEATDFPGNSTHTVTGAFRVIHPPHYPVVLGIEAEDFDTYSDPDGEPGIGLHDGVSGNRYLGWIAEGEEETYTIDIPLAGYYNLEVKYASPVGDRTLYAGVDGEPAYAIGLGNTGGWEIFGVTRSTDTVYLAAGAHTVRLVHQGGYNVDYVSFQNTEDSPVYVNSTGFTEFSGIGEPGSEVEMIVKLAGTEYTQGEKVTVDEYGKFTKPVSIYAEEDNLFEVYGYAYTSEWTKSGVSNSVFVYLDKTYPVIDIASPLEGEEFIAKKDTVTVHFTVTDNVDMPLEIRAYIKHEGGEEIDVADGQAIEPLDIASGFWDMIVEAADYAGNSTATVSGKFKVIHDILPPRSTVEITNPKYQITNEIYVTSVTNFTLSVVDDLVDVGDGIGLGISDTRYQISDAGWMVYEGTFSITGEDDIYEISYYSTDVIGNTEEENQQEVILDNTAPVTEVGITGPEYTVPLTTETYITSLSTITLSSEDPGMYVSGVKEIRYRIADTGWQVYDAGFHLEEGAQLIEFRGYDNLGNEENLKSRVIYADDTPPVTALSIGEPSCYIEGEGVTVITSLTPIDLERNDPSIDGAASGVYLTYYSIDGETPEVYTGPFSVTGSDGYHAVTYWSVDNLSNTEETQTCTVYLDNTAPECALVSPNPESLGVCTVFKATVPVYGMVADGMLASWRLEYAPGKDAAEGYVALADGTEPFGEEEIALWDLYGLDDGFYTLRLVSEDILGNTGVSSMVIFAGEPEKVSEYRCGDDRWWQRYAFKPAYVAVDGEDFSYVTDQSLNRIIKFDGQGEVVSVLGGPPERTSFVNRESCNRWKGDWRERLRFAKPEGITVDSEGNIYVADKLHNRVVKLDSEGNILLEIGGQGEGRWSLVARCWQNKEYSRKEKTFNRPTGVAVDSGGYIWVADRLNNRLQKFTPDGELVEGATIDTDIFDDEHGHWHDHWHWWNSMADYAPGGMAIDSEDNIYVADQFHERVLKFSPSGELLMEIGEDSEKCKVKGGKWNGRHPWYRYKWNKDEKGGSGPGEFRDPDGITVTPQGYIYVTDQGNNRVQKFDKYGSFVMEWGGRDRCQMSDARYQIKYKNWKKEKDEFNSPGGIACDSAGRVHVADRDNRFVKVFDAPDEYTPMAMAGAARSKKTDGPDPAFVKGEIYSFPNPARCCNPKIHFECGIAEKVEIYIYNVAAELVHAEELTGRPMVVDNKYAYEYEWDTSGIASGVYLYLVKAFNDGEVIKELSKLAIIK
ncbi:MAG: hypothetical protein JXJ19_10235 [Elusimicrobia bacterium]|nr:hypothetical protein [Elusimicrobiota bacterium]